MEPRMSGQSEKHKTPWENQRNAGKILQAWRFPVPVSDAMGSTVHNGRTIAIPSTIRRDWSKTHALTPWSVQTRNIQSASHVQYNTRSISSTELPNTLFDSVRHMLLLSRRILEGPESNLVH